MSEAPNLLLGVLLWQANACTQTEPAVRYTAWSVTMTYAANAKDDGGSSKPDKQYARTG